jgi:hypothetical protein
MKTIEAPRDRHIDIFSGARNWIKLGRDECLYIVSVGEVNRDSFEPIMFRILPNGDKEWLSIPNAPKDRHVDIVESLGKAYLVWHNDDKRSWGSAELPGYVAAEFTGELPPPIDVIEIPEEVVREVAAVDQEGREYTTAVKKELYKEIGEVEAGLLAKIAELAANTDRAEC